MEVDPCTFAYCVLAVCSLASSVRLHWVNVNGIKNVQFELPGIFTPFLWMSQGTIVTECYFSVKHVMTFGSNKVWDKYCSKSFTYPMRKFGQTQIPQNTECTHPNSIHFHCTWAQNVLFKTESEWSSSHISSTKHCRNITVDVQRPDMSTVLYYLQFRDVLAQWPFELYFFLHFCLSVSLRVLPGRERDKAVWLLWSGLSQ